VLRGSATDTDPSLAMGIAAVNSIGLQMRFLHSKVGRFAHDVVYLREPKMCKMLYV
jgi:hypothetical protein